MKSKTITSLLIFGLILITSVQLQPPGVALPPPRATGAATNPICSSPGKLDLKVDDLTGTADEIQFDAVSTFLNMVSYDTVELFLKYGDGSNGFKFIMFDDQFSTKIELFCQATATHTFLALLNNLLVTKDPGTSKYYACKFNPAAAGFLPTAELLLPAEIATPTMFIPVHYLASSSRLVVAVSDDTTGSFYSNDCSPTFVTGSTTITPTNLGASGAFSHPLDQVNGNGLVFFDPVDKVIKSVDGQGLYTSRSNLFPVTRGDHVTLVPLNGFNLEIMILAQDQLSGNSYLLDQAFTLTDIPTDQVILRSSTTPYQYWTDDLLNLVIIGQNFIYWANLNALLQYRTVIVSDNIDISTLVDVSLSGNKAIIFYDDRVDYYQIVGLGVGVSAGGSSAIEHLFGKTLSPWSTNGQYRFGLSCMCGGISRSACRSSTLNCLIIKSSIVACGTKDIPAVLTG